VTQPIFTPSCTAPGAQGVLFELRGARRSQYRVVDAAGVEQVRAETLGVIASAARRIAIETGVAWVCCSDGATARLDGAGVSTNSPESPWIRILADALEDTP